MTVHTVGTRAEHLAARTELLAAEKELTRRGDELACRRRELPWVVVEKDYVFDTGAGERTLRQLFAGRSQLLVYHFMFGPEWAEGCPLCSFWADSFDSATVHLAHRDVTMLCASRAPLSSLDQYRRRMGWSFEWVSSLRSDFNDDFGVHFSEEARAAGAAYNFGTQPAFGEETPGLSAFALEDGVVHHTYSCFARGLDAFNSAYQLLDRAPKGRDEDDLPRPFVWIRRHDQYDQEPALAAT